MASSPRREASRASPGPERPALSLRWTCRVRGTRRCVASWGCLPSRRALFLRSPSCLSKPVMAHDVAGPGVAQPSSHRGTWLLLGAVPTLPGTRVCTRPLLSGRCLGCSCRVGWYSYAECFEDIPDCSPEQHLTFSPAAFEGSNPSMSSRIVIICLSLFFITTLVSVK